MSQLAKTETAIKIEAKKRAEGINKIQDEAGDRGRYKKRREQSIADKRTPRVGLTDSKIYDMKNYLLLNTERERERERQSEREGEGERLFCILLICLCIVSAFTSRNLLLEQIF